MDSTSSTVKLSLVEPIIIEGKHYQTTREALVRYQIQAITVRHRLRSGWTLEAAIKTPVAKTISKKTIQLDGVSYPSFASACSAHEIDMTLVYQRLSRGWSMEEAVIFKCRLENGPLCYSGKTYSSLGELCKEFSIPTQTVKSRLAKNIPLHDALTGKIRAHKKNVLVKGKQFKSIRAAAQHYGCIYQTVAKRIARGYSTEQALGLEPPPYHRIVKGEGITLRGKWYASLKEASEELNLPCNKVYDRIALGWNNEQALGLAPPPSAKRAISINGEIYPNMSKACEALGISYASFRNRLKKGCSPEKAMSTKRAISIKGVTYPNMKKACEALGMSYANVRYRLKKGWSPEKAMGLVD